jgi:hypothetical protein
VSLVAETAARPPAASVAANGDCSVGSLIGPHSS